MNNLIQDEDEDVVLEGSELHRALKDMGYTNFDSAPKVKESFNYQETDLSIIENYNNKSLRDKFSENINSIYQLICEDNILKRKELEIILKSNVILDDHAAEINDFYNDHSVSKLRTFFENLPFISSAVIATCYGLYSKPKSIKGTALVFAMLGFFMRTKYKHWMMSKKLRHLVALQNELHNLIKKNLKILRRNFRKKSAIIDLHEKQEILGNSKYNAVLTMREFTIDVFQNLIPSYHRNGQRVLYCLPQHSFYDFFSPVDIGSVPLLDDNRYNKNYDEIKTLYYNYILVQSELMYMIACAYHEKVQSKSFQSLKIEIYTAVNNLIEVVNMYYGLMKEIMERYEMCEIHPTQRVFKGLPNSKWQDTYIHLDLTSQRIQLAYKEIQSILEAIDTHPVKDDDQKLIDIISEKMNEAYKQIENAKSFAEFSTLLIAKAQCKPTKKAENDNENENLFPNENDNRAIVVIDKDREIEDEVFEEYIKEEYLKPLYENSDGALEDYKLDKLLAKNFMTELKEALIEKQQSMSEREFKALRRMYNKVRRESIMNKIDSEKSDDDKPVISVPIPPPPPPLPPPILENTIIAENNVEENEEDRKKNRGPVPLPRVKMLQPNEEIPEVQRFSISECTPNFQFPPFKVAEETFLGSGENSEEEVAESDSDVEEDVVDN